METSPATGLIETVLYLQQAASAALAAGNPETAYSSTVQALELLGDSYELASVCDDTSLTRLIAAELVQHGELQRGAEAMASVLADRITLFRMKFGTTYTPAAPAPLAPIQTPAPVSASETPFGARFCIGCGSPRQAAALFCINCGAPIVD